ncbi:MAG TPA: cyclopropane-fatty-acyl-phospholipid synthase family protein [Turneriella sp.]|nr:cyclopropane-fatty-acyl-phospholipid synthase family protein [Turneriella sp.]
MKNTIDSIVSRGILPDAILRLAIRKLNRRRLKEISFDDIELAQAKTQEVVQILRSSEIAVLTEKANEQHYEVPADFFNLVLGKHLKYSSCYFLTGKESLDEAEFLMLNETIEMARIQDGDEILELGCGWGSLSLFMAQKFPRSKITAVSNSKSQKAFIDAKAKQSNLKNLNVVTVDINNFNPKKKFDRVVSVEMFEHMRNYETLFSRIHSWLKTNGTLFIHIFAHRDYPYFFENKDADDWMSRYFFSGGIMPSNHLFSYFSRQFSLKEHRVFKGTHYHLTAEHWLRNLDTNRLQVLDIFSNVYGKNNARRWLHYWRVFFLAVSELFRTKSGQVWCVNHYLYKKL